MLEPRTAVSGGGFSLGALGRSRPTCDPSHPLLGKTSKANRKKGSGARATYGPCKGVLPKERTADLGVEFEASTTSGRLGLRLPSRQPPSIE